jgi:protein tyrosine/serine phosphatase
MTDVSDYQKVLNFLHGNDGTLTPAVIKLINNLNKDKLSLLKNTILIRNKNIRDATPSRYAPTMDLKGDDMLELVEKLLRKTGGSLKR